MATSMHTWDDDTNRFAHAVIDYAVERVHLAKDTQWGAHPADVLQAAIAHAVAPQGVGGLEALRLFREVLLPACRPMDDPMNLAYVPTAPSVASTMFDLVVSASSIFGGNWEAGAGAIAAENQALRWLADLAGFPPDAGGVFVSGGSAANLSALVTAREVFTQRRGGRPPRYTVAVTEEVHASVRAAARVMDVDVLPVHTDAHGRMTGAALDAALHEHEHDSVFAVVATGGTTNAGVIDELDPIADVCQARGLWMHVDGAYGLAALCSSIVRDRFHGIERADSFIVDPHKWLFAPYDSAALIYRDPRPAAATHAQHGAYLDAVNRGDWNPSDYAYHLSRRARGLPLWFGLATYGTQAYTDAVDGAIRTAASFADEVSARPQFQLLLPPELSVVLFTRIGWSSEQYAEWSKRRAGEGRYLVVPTSWRGEPCLRICIVHPLTELGEIVGILDDLVSYQPA